jgi:hypothetical protein
MKSIAGNSPSRPTRQHGPVRTAIPTARGRNRWAQRSSRPNGRLTTQNPKSCRWDLNPGPRPYQGRALPTEPRQQVVHPVPISLLRPRPARFVRGRRRSVSGPSRAPDTSAAADAPFVASLPRSSDPLPRRAGDGNRTHVACLEGRYSTIELHPRSGRRPIQSPRTGIAGRPGRFAFHG